MYEIFTLIHSEKKFFFFFFALLFKQIYIRINQSLNFNLKSTGDEQIIINPLTFSYEI